MRRIDIPLPWPGVTARLGAFGIPGEESRLPAPMRRVHQSRCARALAVDLLAEQGAIVEMIGKTATGAPVWPRGFVGSLAHTDHYAAAAVGVQGLCAAVGIDVEPAEPLPDDAAGLVLTDPERAWIATAGRAHPSAARMIFCAKECVHKAIHPLTGAWLDFTEVRIEVAEDFSGFQVHPLSNLATKAFSDWAARGHLLQIEHHLVAVLALMPQQQVGTAA